MRRSGHAHTLAPDSHHIASAKLATAARLRVAVDGHGLLEQQRLGFGAGASYARQLEELTEPDHLAADLDLLQAVDVARWAPAASSRQGYYKVNKEMAAIGKARGSEECGTSPGTSLLAITLGSLIIVPPFVSVYKTWARLRAAERLTGTPEGMEPGLGFLLSVLLSPVGSYILQANMNKVLKQQTGSAAVEAAPMPAPA